MLAWPFPAIIISPGSYSYLPLSRSASLRSWNLLHSGIEQLKVGIPEWPDSPAQFRSCRVRSWNVVRYAVIYFMLAVTERGKVCLVVSVATLHASVLKCSSLRNNTKPCRASVTNRQHWRHTQQHTHTHTNLEGGRGRETPSITGQLQRNVLYRDDTTYRKTLETEQLSTLTWPGHGLRLTRREKTIKEAELRKKRSTDRQEVQQTIFWISVNFNWIKLTSRDQNDEN